MFLRQQPGLRTAPDRAAKGHQAADVVRHRRAAAQRLGLGQAYLKGGVAAATADMGKGKLYLLAPEVTFRSQPHGTYKLLFNSIYYGPAKASK